MEESTILKKVYEIENIKGLSKITILGIPIWRIFRYHTRINYINKVSNYVASSASPTIVGRRKIKIFSGFWKYLFKDIETLFFPFNRLVNLDGFYLDKFIDPVIEESELKEDSFLIIDPPNYEGNYKRLHKNRVESNESRLISVQIMARFFKILVPVIFRNKINLIYSKIKEDFLLSDNYKTIYYSKLAYFFAYYLHYLFWLKLISPRRVLIVYREGYFPVIAACKKLGIPIAEFQHGITLENTVSFTGGFDVRIDPDYFLVFGEYWKGPQFGIDINRIHCIGWAYKDMIKRQVSVAEKMDSHTVLVISSPEISEILLDVINELSFEYPDYRFHIRLHPCENYNAQQMEKLLSIKNAVLADNKKDSASILPLYDYVIGENSSVLYEALSTGCQVGLLNFGGLRAPVEKPGIKDSFIILNTPQDFKLLILSKTCSEQKCSTFYTDFDNKLFTDFLNNYM